MVESATLQTGGGLSGDYYADATSRALSFMADEIAAEIEAKGLAGFCTSKFTANLKTKGLDYSALRAGDRLLIGDTVVVIEQAGKECFLDCPIEDRAACPMRTQCAFGFAEKGGAIQKGDSVTIRPAE